MAKSKKTNVRDRMLTVPQAAKAANIPLRSAYRYASKGLPPFEDAVHLGDPSEPKKRVRIPYRALCSRLGMEPVDDAYTLDLDEEER